MNVRVIALVIMLLCVGAMPALDGRVSLDVRGASIFDVIALLAKESGANIVAGDSIKPQHVTLRLADVSFRTALRVLARSYDLVVVESGPALILEARDAARRTSEGPSVALRLHHASADDVARSLTSMLPASSVVVPDARTNIVLVESDAASLARARALVDALDADGSAIPFRTATVAYRLRFTRAQDVAKELKSLLPDGTFVPDDQQNAILVTGDETTQRDAAHAVEVVDVAGPQVLFEVRVADVTPENDSRDVGFEFGGLDLQGQSLLGGTTYAFAGGTVAVNVRLNALVTSGEAQILATPRLVTLNGKEADLLIGETYPVVYNTSVLGGSSVQFVDIGVKLRLTPIIGPDGSVTAELHPEYSEIQGFTASGYPIIANRKIDSTLRVQSGQTIVLGGLLRDTSSQTVERLPWLSDIPVLGKVFQNRQTAHERDEIVFLITPRIVNPQAPPSR